MVNKLIDAEIEEFFHVVTPKDNEKKKDVLIEELRREIMELEKANRLLQIENEFGRREIEALDLQNEGYKEELKKNGYIFEEDIDDSDLVKLQRAYIDAMEGRKG